MPESKPIRGPYKRQGFALLGRITPTEFVEIGEFAPSLEDVDRDLHVALLNKGGHFDALVAHIKRERQGLANLLEFRWITDPGHRQAIHEAIMEADAVIASTEVQGDG